MAKNKKNKDKGTPVESTTNPTEDPTEDPKTNVTTPAGAAEDLRKPKSKKAKRDHHSKQ